MQEITKSILKRLKAIEKDTSKKPDYPVIYINLKNIKGNNFEEMKVCLQNEIKNLLTDFSYLLNSKKVPCMNKAMFEMFLKSELYEDEFSISVNILLRMLCAEYEKKVYLLIDEYDVPLNNSYRYGFFSEAVNFFHLFYKVVFNDNSSLEKAIITAATNAFEKDIFSGINNYEIVNILNNRSSKKIIKKEEGNVIKVDFSDK